MRMWMISPKLLCTKHLMGEHGEIHKFLPTFRKGYSVDGRFKSVIQIQLNALEERHDRLAEEIDRRAKKGGGHKSPLKNIPDLAKIYPQHYNKCVDIENSLSDLIERCPECKDKILAEGTSVGRLRPLDGRRRRFESFLFDCGRGVLVACDAVHIKEGMQFPPSTYGKII